jgi:hypothetical protein
MADHYTHVSYKIEDDDVDAAIAKAREVAIDKLGGKDVALCTYSWTPDYVCTKWMRTVPDTPNP